MRMGRAKRRAGRAAGAMIIALALVSFAACGSSPPSVQSTLELATPTFQVAEDQLQRWIEFRQAFGLRSDVEWVVAVAGSAEASSVIEGVPLLEFEEAQVIRLSQDVEGLLSPVQAYGNRFRDEYAGAWIEAPFVVIAFTDHIAEHRTAIESRFESRVLVRPARYSLRDLHILAADVGEQAAWFESIGAQLVQADVEITMNAVQVSYRAPDRTVEAQILARFGNPGWLEFDYRGPPTD